MQWSAEQENALRRYWDEGYTCVKIAALLSKQYSETYTRNSIIGKVHRLHLQSRSHKSEESIPVTVPILKEIKSTKPINKPAKVRKRMRLGKKYDDDEFFTKVIQSLRTKLCEKEIVNIPDSSQCKYITGDVKFGDAKWCRESVNEIGSSWCLEHRKLVYAGFRYESIR